MWHLQSSLLFLFVAVATLATASEADSEHLADVNHSDHDVNGSHGNDTGHHKDHAEGVHVVHIQFDYVEQPLILTLFLIHVVLIKIGQCLLVHGTFLFLIG